MSLLYSSTDTINKGTTLLNAITLNTNTIFRFEVNFNLSTIKSTHIIDMRNSNKSGYQPLYISTSTFQFHIANSELSIDWPYKFKANTDYHVEIILSNKEIAAFVNNIKIPNPSGTPGSFTLPLGTYTLNIGHRFEETGGTRYTINDNGTIWGIKIFDDSESVKIKSNYNILCRQFEEAGSSIITPSTCKTGHFFEPEYKIIDKVTFMKVFDHDVSAAPKKASSYFSSENEALWSLVPGKFSVLNYLSSLNNGTGFTFRLSYPFLGKYIQWTQDLTPFNYYGDYVKKATNISTNAEDGTLTKWDGYGLYRQGKVNQGSTLFECQSSDDSAWYGSIGRYVITSADSPDFAEGIPTPFGNWTNRVKLWVAVTGQACPFISKDVICATKFIEKIEE